MRSDLRARLRALFRREAVEQELDEELTFHLERSVEKLMRQGLSRGAAERQARLALGGVEQTKEECRRARGVGILEGLMKDASFAVRMLRKSPGFTLAVVLSLGLGIGANTAIFSLIDAVMWRSLPVESPETLLAVVHGQDGQSSEGFTYQQFRAFEKNRHNVAGVAAYATARLNVAVNGGVEPTAAGQLVSDDYFALLGVRPQLGRALGDDRRPVVMLSDGYWRRRFAADPQIIGRSLRISGMPFEVMGVTPPEFFGVEVGVAPDLFVPLRMQPVVMPAEENLLENPIHYSTWVKVIARLAPGVTASHVAAAWQPVYQSQVPQGFKAASLRRERVSLTPAGTGISALRQEFSQPLFLLMAVVGVVLLIACANVANLLLARAAARQAEFRLRLALGAGRARVMAQLLVESALLAVMAGAVGVALAQGATRWLVSFLGDGRSVPMVLRLAPDGRLLLFTTGVSVLTALLFGLAPAWFATRKVGTRAPGKMLAVAQVALSLVLLFAAGLFARSLNHLSSRMGSARNERVLVVRVDPKGSDQRNAPGVSERLDRTYRELAARVSTIPGVQAAGLAQFTPTNLRGYSGDVEIPGGETVRTYVPMIYPGYFAAAGVELLLGRDLDERDLRPKAPLVSVVNETFARRVFPHERHPVGKRYQIGDETREVVGLVRDSLLHDVRASDAGPISYQPFLQTVTGRGQMALYVRAAGNAASILPEVRRAVQAVDLTLPMFEVRTLRAEIEAVLVRERLLALLSSLFGTVALALACIGIYGLFAFTVVRRRRELAVRQAIGAGQGTVVWTVMREVLMLVGLGLALGIPAALACAKLAASRIAGLLFGPSAMDPLTIGGASMVLVLVAAVAGYLPARQASRMDPMAALRVE